MLSNFLKNLKNDSDYRLKCFLLVSLVLNFAYALFFFIVSRIYFSKWFFVMSIYYGLLTTARIFIFFQVNPKKELKQKLLIMRLCGYFLLLLNLVVSIMMFMLIYTTQPVKHHEITVISLATATFSTLTFSIVSSVKQLKKNDCVYSCIKAFSSISASISLVTLANTMLATWGEEKILLRNIVLPILCSAVASFIIVCAILMIVKANHNLRKLKNEKNYE